MEVTKALKHKLRFNGGRPIVPLMGLPGCLATQTTVRHNLEDASTQFESLKFLHDHFRPDAMITMMDLTVEAEALGLEIWKPEDNSYSILDHPIKTLADLKMLKAPDPEKSARMPIFLDVVERMNRAFDCPVIAYVIGPFTLCGLLTGATQVIKSVLKKPEFLEELLSFSTGVVDRYARALVASGATSICILEPTATVLSPIQFKKFSGDYIQDILRDWNVPSILHICGDSRSLISEMLRTGCAALSLDSQVDLTEVIEQAPEDVLIIGNIDPVDVVAHGDDKTIRNVVQNLVMKMAERKNFVLSTGCDLPLDTPLENIEAMVSSARGHIP
jgi:uroporphyrinogen decarboxylase